MSCHCPRCCGCHVPRCHEPFPDRGSATGGYGDSVVFRKEYHAVPISGLGNAKLSRRADRRYVTSRQDLMPARAAAMAGQAQRLLR